MELSDRERPKDIGGCMSEKVQTALNRLLIKMWMLKAILVSVQEESRNTAKKVTIIFEKTHIMKRPLVEL